MLAPQCGAAALRRLGLSPPGRRDGLSIPSISHLRSKNIESERHSTDSTGGDARHRQDTGV